MCEKEINAEREKGRDEGKADFGHKEEGEETL
jgi:hypothetical protein